MKGFMAVIYGDLLMKVLYGTRPYEKVQGSANQLYEKWMGKCKESLKSNSIAQYRENIRNIIREFDVLPLRDISKPKVGIVGEILVKFHPTANNNIVQVLEAEGVEVVVPDLMDFTTYCAYDAITKYKYLSGSRKDKLISKVAIKFIESFRKVMTDELRNSSRFYAPKSIEDMANVQKI